MECYVQIIERETLFIGLDRQRMLGIPLTDLRYIEKLCPLTTKTKMERWSMDFLDHITKKVFDSNHIDPVPLNKHKT